MSEYVGLYYPFLGFNDDGWLKLAVLYWDKLGRIVPIDYVPRDSDTARQLTEELGFIKNFAPSSDDVLALSEMFSALIRKHQGKLESLYGRDAQSNAELAPGAIGRDYTVTLPVSKTLWINYEPYLLEGEDDDEFVIGGDFVEHNTPFLAHINPGKFETALPDILVKAGLARRERRGLFTTVAMHPKLAFIYMEVLAERMATTRQLHPVTDNVLDHVASSGYSIERLTQALLESDDTRRKSPRSQSQHRLKSLLTHHEIEVQMATVALQAILPKDIASIPTKKIIQLRNQHRDEMTAFQTTIHDFATDLEKLEDIDDPAALKAHLESEYERKLQPQLNDLKKRFKSLGIDTVTGAMNIRVALPPLLASGGAAFTQAHLGPVAPFVIGAGAVAFSVFPVIREKQKEASEIVRSSPAAYLLYTQEYLEPTNLVSQVTQRARQMLFGV